MQEKGPGRPRATTHDEIRSIATALFAEQGYGQTSLEQIAQAAGISRTTLFSYFPAKRDLIWEELLQRRTRMDAVLAEATDRPIVDLVVDLVLNLVQFPTSSREALATRWRIVQNDAELRAYRGLQSTELARLIVDEAVRRDPDADPHLVDHVVHALSAVAIRCTEEWAQGVGSAQDLDAYTATQLSPIAAALRSLLA